MIQKNYNLDDFNRIQSPAKFTVKDELTTSIHREKLESILANAVDAIITIDDCGIVESVNPATVSLFGFEAEEIVGNNIKILMPEPFQSNHDGYIRNFLESGFRKIIGIGREVVGKRKDGSTFPMHLAVSEIQFDGKRMFTGIVRDISDVKAAEKELSEINEQLEERVRQRTEELHRTQASLVQSEKLATLGQVAGGIAHEIRNPLNAVKTSAYYLTHAKEPAPDKIREHLERIDRQVALIDNVITALSDVAKLPDAKLVPGDISELLTQVTRSTTLPGNIDIKLMFEDDLPNCIYDKNQIPIAFRNLIRNARDAMPDGGRLTVGATLVGSHIEAFVEDDGIGIPKEELEKILEPLFTTKARGMGLGLAITRAIVDKNKCQLNVSSVEGQGSRFTVCIPVAQS